MRVPVIDMSVHLEWLTAQVAEREILIENLVVGDLDAVTGEVVVNCTGLGSFTLFDDKAHANLSAHLTAAKYAQVMVPIVDSLTGLAMAVVIVVGGSRVLDQRLDVGRL